MNQPPEKAPPATDRQPAAAAASPEEVRRTVLLRSAAFRRGREQSWRRLDHMVSLVETKGLRALSAAEIQELPLLYRSTTSALAVARNIVLDRNLLLYLENLCLRAYLVVYGPRSGIMHNLSLFFTRSFPRAVRSMRWHLLIVLAALAAGGLGGYLLVAGDINYFNMLVPEELAGSRGPGSTAEDLRQGELFAPWPGFTETFIVFTNSLFRHNTIVGILCFGLGFALGLPTILLLAYQGLVLGAFIALHARHHLTVDFIGWLSIHGVTEILAILLCGAAGLVIAEKILFPGPLPRLTSLSRFGCRAAGVAAGAVVLFFIAGLLEGGFRQLISNTPGRYAFAIATGALWLLYFTTVGREDRHGRKN